MRASLAAGDVPFARNLALHGDGQARDLAREYAFMVRGLGVTVRVLLQLLLEKASRADAQAAPRAASDLASLLVGLLQWLLGPGEDATPSPSTDAGLVPLADACAEALRATQERFSQSQARRAREVIAALAEGDVQSARSLLDAKDAAYLTLHDPFVRFMADAFAWVLRHFGTRALLEFHLATAEAQRDGFEKWESMPPDGFAAVTAFLLKQHMGQVTVEEDAIRFTIRQSPCGSGGRLRLDGAYAGQQPLPFVEERGPLTFGEPRMPVYCTHCAIWNGSATLRWFGHAQWSFEQPARADGGCTLHIYKRREDAPAEYASRVAVPTKESRS